MLIAHFSDTHLGLKPYGYEWFHDKILEDFRNAVEKALEEHVDAILFSGDLFDKPRPSNRVLKTVIETVSYIRSKGIPVYSVMGEHDLPKARNEISPQLIIPGLYYFYREDDRVHCREIGGRRYCIGGVSHYPLKHGPRTKTRLLKHIKTIANKLEGVSILMLHQNIRNFEVFEEGLEINELPEKPVYIAMGHLHRRIVYRRDNGQYIVYPGSLEIVKRDEIRYWKKQGKGFYLVDLSGDEPIVNPVDIDIVPQEIVETTRDRIRIDVEKKIRELPRDRDSILHIIIELKPDEKIDIRGIVERIVKKYSTRIHCRFENKYIEETGKTGETIELDSVDEVKVIQSLLGTSDNKLAEKIYLLKEAVVREDYDTVYDLVEEIVNHSFWSKKIRPPQITLPSTLEKKIVTDKKPGETGKKTSKINRDLLSFFG